jgi:PAS domain S-box-containing protein
MSEALIPRRAPSRTRHPPAASTGGLPPLQRWFSGSLGAYALAGALVTLLGWATDTPRLTDWFANGISMQPNAAAAAGAAGAALLLVALGRRRAGAWFGLAAALVGAATLVEHLSGRSLGIDTLLFARTWGNGATTAPGRMGPPASVCLILLGLGLFLISGRIGGRSRGAASALGLAASFIALNACIGYAFGADRLYAVARWTGIALQTATILLALGVGLVVAIPERQPARTLWQDSGAGLLVRRALPLVVLLPVVLGWLRVKAQQEGLVDTGTGTGLLVFLLVVLLCAVLAWGSRVVAAREQSIAALDEARVRADMALGAARDQFIVLDREWRYTYVNNRVSEVTAIPREELLGRPLWDSFPELADPALEDALRRVMTTRETATLEYYHEPWGRWFDTRIYPTADGGVALFLAEVTDRKRAEQALRDADRRKSEFLALLAHELRNPLAVVTNSLEVLARARGDADLTTQVLPPMKRQVAQMVRLIDDLFDVSRIAHDRLDLRRTQVDVGVVVRDAVASSRTFLDGARQHLRVAVPEEPVWVDGDPVRLAQVFGNLLGNASKYSDPGATIWLSLERVGGEAVVRVRDEGAGIPAEMLAAVFDLFTQLDRPLERSHGGLGIGLTLVKQLVELHGGTVAAHSEGEGRGSELVVRLPVLEEVPRAEPPARSRRAAAPVVVRRVLVVEDNPDIATSLSTWLTLARKETQVAMDGLQALEKAESFRPDAILLDLGLPGIDGFEVCREIRAQPWGKNILVIALTGWGRPEDRVRTTEAGFDAHLVKPIDYSVLLRLLSVPGEGSEADSDSAAGASFGGVSS